jgi:hypothetical protein
MKIAWSCFAMVLFLSSGCGTRSQELPPGTITVSIQLDERFNMRLISGLRIFIDSLAQTALHLEATDGGVAHEVGGVAFTTQVTNVDNDADLEWLVEFPRSPFVSRSFDFHLFPSLEESVPFSVGVDVLGPNGSIATASATQDAGGEPIRFRRGTASRVILTVPCREGYTCISANGAPSFDTVNMPERNVTAGETVLFSVSATDPEGDRLVYSAQMGRPGEALGPLVLYGAYFDPGTRIFSWTPTEDHVPGIDPAPYMVEFRATDPGGLFAVLPVRLRVSTANQPPVFGEVRPQVVFEGDLLTFHVPVTDPEDDPLALDMTLSALGGTIDFTSRATFDPSTQVFTWQTQKGDGSEQAYRATFTASDSRHRPVELRVDIHVIFFKRSDGSSCNENLDCQSGICSDFVCCKERCDAGQVCTGPEWTCKKKRGQRCTEPKDCATGFCVDTTCCASSFCVDGFTCENEAGECKKRRGMACGFDAECASGHCVSGACCTACEGPPRYTCASPAGECRLVKGETCEPGGIHCAEGLSCWDGVCCSAAPRCPPCHGCNLPGRKGDCVPFEEEDPRGECGGLTTGGNAACKQVCRAGACVWPGPERPCDDRDPCTTQDACTGDGRCAGTPWVVENPVPSAYFSDIVALPSSEVLVASRGGPVYRYDGTRWVFEDTRTGMPVRAFSALPNDEVFAVGERVILRRQAGQWSATPVNADLRGIWAGSPNLAFAVGQEPGSGLAVLWQWDGTRWSWERAGEGELHAVAGHLDAASTRFLAVAVGLARDLTGTASPWILVNDGATTCGGRFWCRQALPLPPGLMSEAVALRSVVVWGLTRAAAVGDRGLFAEYTAGLGWTTKCFDESGVPVLCPDEPVVTPGLGSIARSADGYLHVTRGRQILRGKDGVWLEPYVVQDEERVDRVAPLSLSQFYAASATGGLVAQGFSLPPQRRQPTLRALLVLPGGDVYAGGDTTRAAAAAFLKRADRQWDDVDSAGPVGSESITALSARDDSQIVAATQGGQVMKYDPILGWICPEDLTPSPLTSLWVAPPGAGSRPVAGSASEHFRRPQPFADGKFCEKQIWSSEKVSAFSIWGPSTVISTARYYVATGRGIQAYELSDLGSWVPAGLETPLAQARAVFGTSETNVWAVGNEIKRFNGSTWVTAGPSGQNLCALAGAGRTLVALGGGCAGSSTNNVLFFDGALWKTERVPVVVGLNAVAGNEATGEYFAAGQAGFILRRCSAPGATP